jgi:MIP family channel proteins
MDRPMAQRLTAEVVGTFTLIFIGAGSVIATQGGVDGGSLVAVALAHGLAIATMVSAVGHVSGGHVNPAVTVGAWVTRRIGSGAAAAYIVVQLVGATLGALALRLLLPGQLWGPVSLGTPQVSPLITDWQAIALEAVLTFFLVWVVFATAMDPEGSFGKIAGLAIGFSLTMSILAGAPLTGAALNPARSFGPAIVSGELTGIWVYFLGPVIGGTVAALLYDLGIMRRQQV